MNGKPPTRLTHQAYTIGWICALPKEAEAASFMLDEEHADLVNPGTDTNSYWLGAISGHNVAIACLPSGSYGNNSSATVATRMISTFPNIKVGLMVGIGGGIPPNVRLGDVVISQSKNGHNAVVQWDMGKTEEGGKFKRTGSLNNPPTAVMTALSKFQANSVRSRQKIEACLNGLKTREDVPKSFIKSDSMKDPLDATLGAEDMRIHYGLIASGNQVIKDTATRDKLNADFDGDVLCVEMEAAGLMNDFPCLVIRGICDYADELKNKVWQEYAAAVAAAYAKSLLSVLPASEINGLKSITIQDFVQSTFLEDVRKRLWGDKKKNDTPTAVSDKIQANGATENQNGHALPTQTDKPTAGDTSARLRDTNSQQDSPTQPAQPGDSSSSSPQERDIESGMRNININCHKPPSPLAGEKRGHDTEQEKGTNTTRSQHEPKQERDNASEFDNSHASQGHADYSHFHNTPPEGSQYRRDQSQTSLSHGGHSKGTSPDRSGYRGGSQDENGNNPETQPTWSGNGIYGPGTHGPRDISYQTPPYQSPANKNSNNMPGQYNGSYSGNPQVQNGIYPQTPPSTWSGGGSYPHGAPNPQSGYYQTPPYQSPVYSNNSQMPSQYNGNCTGNPQNQNGNSPQTLPIWSRNSGYTPAAPGPPDYHYPTPPYQSPAYNDNASTPNQYSRYGIEFASTVPCGYSQNLPTQNLGYSGNGYQNSLEVGGSISYDVYRGWHGINDAAVGANRPYNTVPGPKLNDLQTKYNQALFQAVRSGGVAFVEQLLRSGADPEMKDASGATPLWIAVQNGQLAVVRLLLQYPAADNVLLAAVEGYACDGMRRDDMIKLLITHGALLGANPNSAEDNGNRDDQDLDWWRHALVGVWTGSYNYKPASYGDPMGFQIEMVFRESPSALRKGLILFSGGGDDTVGKFVVYGQIMSGRTIRFVKLYSDFGWAYNGIIKRAEGGGCCMEGQWGGQFSGTPGGYFILTRGAFF